LNFEGKIWSKGFMQSRGKPTRQQNFLMQTLAEQLDRRQPLYKLAERMPWSVFEEEFAEYYSEEGRPAKAVRLMVGLLLLKQMFNVSDEAVVEQWVQNPYWQFFCGMNEFQWALPCDPSDLVYFRRRVGEAGVGLVMAVSANLHGERAREKEVVIDTTVQEKNVTWPTDTKLCRKIIGRCWKAADKNGVKLRRRYGKEVRRCLMAQRWRKDPRKRRAAHKGQRKLKTIAGRLIRELERKLPTESLKAQRDNFSLYRRVLGQKPHDKAKIYSLHEPQVYCMAKGKEHKKYEFGGKASVAMCKQSGVIVAAVAHEKNLYDGDTLPEVLGQAEVIMERRPDKAIVDRGYRGRQRVEGTEVLVPGRAKPGQSKAMTAKMRQRFRRRAAIEPVISHLKHDYRLMRCFLKGFVGDSINLMLAAAAWNFRKWMRECVSFWLRFLRSLAAAQTA
jgi:IS5 family transposase